MPTFTCPIDPTHRFTGQYYQTALQAHMAQYHSQQQQQFTCPIDGQKFASQAELDAHTASAHPGTDPPIDDPNDRTRSGLNPGESIRGEYTTAEGIKYRTLDRNQQYGGGGWALQQYDVSQRAWVDVFDAPFTGLYGISSFNDFVQQAGLGNYLSGGNQNNSWWQSLINQMNQWKKSTGNVAQPVAPSQPGQGGAPGQGSVRQVYQTAEGNYYRTVDVGAGPESIGGWAIEQWRPDLNRWVQIGGESFYQNPTSGRFSNFADFQQALNDWMQYRGYAGLEGIMSTDAGVQDLIHELGAAQGNRLMGQYNQTRGGSLYGPNGEQIQDPYLLALLRQQYSLQHDRPWNLSDQGMPVFDTTKETWDQYQTRLNQWMADPARNAWQTSGQYAQDSTGNWYSIAYKNLSDQITQYMQERGITYGQPTPQPPTPPPPEPPPQEPTDLNTQWYSDQDPSTVEYNPWVGGQPGQGAQQPQQSTPQFSTMASMYQPQQQGALNQAGATGGNYNMPTASNGMRTNSGQSAGIGGGLTGTAGGANGVPDLAGMLGGQSTMATAAGMGGIDQKAIPALSNLMIMKEIGSINARLDQREMVQSLLPAIMGLFNSGGRLPSVTSGGGSGGLTIPGGGSGGLTIPGGGSGGLTIPAPIPRPRVPTSSPSPNPNWNAPPTPKPRWPMPNQRDLGGWPLIAGRR